MSANLLSQIHEAMAGYLPVPKRGPPARPTPRPSASASASAAVAIQSAARGLLARKSLRDLQALDADVRAIERRIQRSLDLLLSDETERLRVHEALMAVLLRLDAVRGARVYRGKVIRRALALQESLDSITGGAPGPPVEECTGEEKMEEEEDLVRGLVEENERLRGVVEGLLEEGAAMARRVGELERRVQRLRRRGKGRRGVVVGWGKALTGVGPTAMSPRLPFAGV